MISFMPLERDNEREILDYLTSRLPEADEGEILDIVSSFADQDDVEVAFSASNGCVLIRIFDSEYLFAYPVAMSASADEQMAIDEMRLYTIKEEISFTIVDTPSDSLDVLTARFKRTEAFDEDEDGTSYTVRVKNELSGLSEFPEAFDGELSLTPPTDEDVVAYAKIATDRDLNKYWGYDYSADRADADGEYFLECARCDAERECALALAIRLNGEMIGEAALYAFDFLGGCECAIRILAKHQGRGYGRRVFSMLESIAKRIGVRRLYATVQKENERSISLFEKQMKLFEENDENIRFYTDL